MKLLFEKASWMLTPDGAYLMLKCDRKDAAKVCDSIKPGKQYQAEVKQYRKQRSLDANAYFWTLCGKVAVAVGTDKEDVYRNLIRDVGDNYEILPIRNNAVDKWIEAWEGKGIGWVCDVIGPSKLDGYTNVITYYGSSTYDTAQMSRLINLIIDECREYDIDTMNPYELESLLEGWNAK